MKGYLIVIERSASGFSAYSPDLPGCVSAGRSREEVEENMREAIAFHLQASGPRGAFADSPEWLQEISASIARATYLLSGTE